MKKIFLALLALSLPAIAIADGLTCLSCAAGGGGGAPGGSSGQVQYNSGGSFGGISGATTNGTVLTTTNQTLNGTVTGTAVSSAVSASTLVLRDGNSNAFANNFVSATASTVSAAGTTVLVPNSARLQMLTGSSSQTFQLPNGNASGMVNGSRFEFNNNSTGSLIVQNHGGTTLYTVPTGGYANVILTDNSTSNGTWDVHILVPSNVTWGTAGGTLITNAGTYASKPASPVQGQQYFATDLGANGVMIVYSGSVWKPLGGVATLYLNGAQTTSHTGDTNEANVATVTIPAGLLSANGMLRISALGVATGTNGTKTYIIRWGANSGSTTDPFIYNIAQGSTILSVNLNRTLYNRNSVSAQVSQPAGNNYTGTSTLTNLTFTLNTAATAYLNFNVQLANAADSAAYSAIAVEWLEP